MAVTFAQQTAVSSLYIALFNRVPDASGLDFWATALSNGASVATISLSFLNSPEAKLIYAGAQTSEQFVSVFYQTVFGRAVDAGGLAFWSGVMNAAGGIGSDAAKALLVSKIVDIVSTPIGSKPANVTDAQYAETIRDRAAFDKKMIISIDFAVTQKNNDVAAAKLAFLEASPTPVTPPGTPPASETLVYRLTQLADTMTGGASDTTFDASLDGGFATLASNDILDGGAGTDTLNVTLINNAPVKPGLSRVEIVNLTSKNVGGVLDLDLATGVEQANILNSTVAGSILHVRTAALSVSNQNIQAGFSGSTAAVLSLNLTNIGAALAEIDIGLASGGAAPSATTYNIAANNAHATITGTGSSLSRVTVAATGFNTLNLSGAINMSTLDVTGAGSVDFSRAVLTALTTFTAGDGGVKLNSVGIGTLTVTTGAGDDTIVANGASIKSLNVGAGNDSVTLKTGTLSSTAVVDLGAGNDTLILTAVPNAAADISGGDGRDTLILNDAGLNYAVISNVVKGFEVLALGATGFNVDRSLTGSMNSFAVANTGTTTFTKTDSASTFAIDNSAAVTAVSIANIAGEGRTDITLTNNAATPAANAIGSLNVSGATQIFLTSSGTSTNSNVITTLIHANNSTITVQGNADLNFGISGAATGTTVDATAFTGKLTVRGSGRDDIITGGAGDDAIYGESGADRLTGGSGNDIFSFYGRGDTRSGFQPSDQTATNIDKITDFSGNGALAGDRISFGIGNDEFGTGVTFSVATSVVVTTLTVATAGDFIALAAAIQAKTPGVASFGGLARVYDVTVTAGNLAGHYLVLNDGADAISASNDTFISITGIVGALDASDFVFGVGLF